MCISSIKAQTKQGDYTVAHNFLSIEDGLSAREVYCGLQDKNGFIWFGTRNGLNRYDGKKVQLYTRRNANMQENNVVQLASNQVDNLFILYGYPGYARLAIGKVDILNTKTGKLESFTKTFKNAPIKEKSIYWIANDGTNRINIMTYNPYQLWQYTSKEGFKLRFEMKDWKTDIYQYNVPTGPFNYFNKNIACLGFGGHEKQYILNNNSVTEFSINESDSFNIVSLKNKQEFVLQKTFKDQKADNFQAITFNSQYKTTINHQQYQLDFIRFKKATSVFVANDTTCIFNVEKKGIYYYNNSALINVIDSIEFSKFPNLFTYQSFADNLGNTWICTSVGVFKIKVSPNKFTQLFTRNQQNIEINNQARNIWVDDAQNIYANIWHHLFIKQKNIPQTKAIKTNTIQYSLVNHSKKIYSTGWDLVEYNTKNFTHSIVPNTKNGKDILASISLNDSILLLGKMEELYKYNTNKKEIKVIKNTGAYINLPYRFFKRKDKTIWVVGENGLLLLDEIGNIIKHFNASKQSVVQLPKDNFTDVFEDSSGTVWLTTSGDGLFKWNTKNNTFKNYAIEDGLPSNILYRIEEDENHNFWISTENGLLFFNPSTEFIYTFYENDGLSNNEFNRMSSYKAADGRMFFGGLNGVNAFYPKNMFDEAKQPNTPLQIIAFQQYSASQNKLIDLTNDLLISNKILVKPDDKFFTIEYRLLDYENKQGRYAYKIDQLDKDWIITTENSIRISGLPYGKYILLIKAQTQSGQWSTSQINIPLEVIAPFYTKWWAQLLLFLIVPISVFIFFRLRNKKLINDKVILENVVEKRTNQLQKSLSERELLLKEIHHRVKNNLQIISGLLDLQKEEIEEEESKAVFNEGQSRVKSIALIHQNLYQNDNLANVKFNSFIKELAVQVGDVFEQLNAKMEVSVDMPDLLLDIDTAVPLGLIINELLTNAFKYATSKNNQGEIKIKILEVVRGSYQLIFSDNGPGIPVGIDFESASTLGLRLIRGLAAQLNGEANYHYHFGGIFTIYFKDSETRKKEN